MIIDVHAHSSPSLGIQSLSPIREQCRRNDVALVLLSSVGRWNHYPGRKEVREANEEARVCAEQSNGLARWLAYLNPQNANWRRELDRCLTCGAIGIKLWVSLKDKKGHLDNTTAVIRAAAEKRLPVLIHTFHRIDNYLPGEISLDELGEMANRFPRATLIAAHAGAHWRLSLNALRHFPRNALVDISGCFPERGIVEALVKELGPTRILFGSDLLGRSQASQLAKVVFADITPQARDAILWKNAARVFGLKPGPPLRAPGPRRRLRLPDVRIDHFCFCGAWPFFPTPARTPKALNRLLAEPGIAKAYTGDLGSIYRLDLDNANSEFIRACHGTGRIAPLAALNPRAVNWRHILAGLSSSFAGVILLPYLHNWRLNDPAYRECFEVLAAKRIPVWINCVLGDYRFRHSGVACRPVANNELVGFGCAAPRNAYVIQGASADLMADFTKRVPARSRFRFEISRLTDASGALARGLREWGASSLVMGSEFPLRDLREVRWVADRERLVF